MKHLIVGTAGHVDHGKTALIKMLTQKDCDTHAEEKRRGITINLGFSYVELPNGETIGIVDVPGHKDFINTMVAGACGIDLVLLVIAADSGIMPQTREHINIVNVLGIHNGIVVLTKCDLVDEELIELAKLEISDYLQNTLLHNAPIIAVSSFTEQGKTELLHHLEQAVDATENVRQSSVFRMYIDRIFNVKGVGTVATGSVLGGSVAVGNDVFLQPRSNQKLKIRSIEKHGKNVDSVTTGDRAAFLLTGFKSELFERGMFLTETLMTETVLVDAHLTFFELNQSIGIWTQAIFISGTFECQVRMHLLNKDTVNSSETALVQIHLTKPAILMIKDRFIIRNSSGTLTLGGGYIIDSNPLHHRKRTQTLVETLNQLSENLWNSHALVSQVYSELKKSFQPFFDSELAQNLHINQSDLPADSLNGEFIIYTSNTNTIYILNDYDVAFKEKALKILSDYHIKNSLFPDGMELNEISGKLNLNAYSAGKGYLEMMLKSLKKENKIDNYNNTWILYNHKPTITEQEKKEIDWLEQQIIIYDHTKPILSEIEEKGKAIQLTQSKIKTYTGFLFRTGKIKIFQGDIIHVQILDKYRMILLKALNDHAEGMEINDFKDTIGGTRKFRMLLTDIYESEKIVSVKRGANDQFIITMTQLGKNVI